MRLCCRRRATSFLQRCADAAELDLVANLEASLLLNRNRFGDIKLARRRSTNRRLTLSCDGYAPHWESRLASLAFLLRWGIEELGVKVGRGKKSTRPRRAVVGTKVGIFLVSLLSFIGHPGCHRDGNGTRTPAAPDGTSPRDAGGDVDSPRPVAPIDGGASEDTSPPDPPPPPPSPPNLAEDQPCLEPTEVALFVAPRRPMVGERLRVMIVSDGAIPGATVWARDPSGAVHQVEHRYFNGPPHAWSVIVESPSAGTWRIALTSGSEIRTCEDITMRTVPPPRRVREHVWPVRYEWDRSYENLYSAWIMQLFHSPPEERPSWRALHEVLRDPERNWLYNRLGIDEDGPDPDDAIRATPDCADTPYFLRAYFAWKMRLLFTFSACTRGRGGTAPTCREMRSNLDPPLEGMEAAGIEVPDAGIEAVREWIPETVAFNAFLNRIVAGTVQSGCGRTLPDDNRSDLYSLELTREAIRPGTIFVDPYGHLLVVVQWEEQEGDVAGMLFAIDGHPDNSIGRKRFWRGAFLFVDDLSWGAGGFKAFRPVFVRRRSGENRIHRLTNAEISAHADWGRFSSEQYSLGTDGFYERMDRVINPNPMNPNTAQGATLAAFYELVQERVDSVIAGEEYMAGRSYREIEMPEGAAIFETSGAWEDYSTPARDLRLLIAMDLVSGYPNRVVAHPDAFAIPPGEAPTEVAAGMRRAAAEYLGSHYITYTRSNGREQRLSLSQVLERQVDMEMGYNPNDCIEIRWGAPTGSEERSSCRRHAPAGQLELMRSYRNWFHTRTRPPRE